MPEKNTPPSTRHELALPAKAAPARSLDARFAPPPSGGGITPAFVLQSLARWWPWALPTALVLSGAAAVIAWLVFKPTFEAESWIRIEDRRPYVAFPSQEESKRFVQTQVETIRSPVILGQCLKLPDIAQLPEVKAEIDPIKWIGKWLAITSVADSELFRVKFKSSNPAAAAKIVNAVIDTYLKHHLSQASLEAQKTIDVLDRLKSERVHELERMQERVRALTKQVTGKDNGGITRPNREAAAAAASPLAALEAQLATAEVERQLVEAQYKAAREILEAEEQANISAAALDQAVAKDPDVAAMTAELQAIRAEAQHYEATSTQPQELASVKQLAKRYTTLKEALQKRKLEVREVVAEEMRRLAQADRLGAIDVLGMELKKQQMKEQVLRTRLTEHQAELEKYGDQALTLEFARSDMERAEEVFRRLSDRITALQTEKAAEARVSQLSPAVPPTNPVTTSAKFVASLAGFCFLFPFALAVIWELRVRRIATVEQLRDEARLPVIGEITAIPARSLLPSLGATARFERQRSAFEESIAHLRTSLVLCDDTSHLQIIVVASAISREGKTSIAAQLAANLARTSNEPTLLVDADLRDPDIHELYEVRRSPGLANVLAGEATLEEAIVPSNNHGVWVLPAGETTIGPHTLFAGTAFPNAIETLRGEYRYVVIDCPPLLAASEALIVARAADGALLCTMRDVSRVTQVRDARDRLVRAGARLLGVVMSGVSAKSYAKRYGGYGYAMVQRGESSAHDDSGGTF